MKKMLFETPFWSFDFGDEEYNKELFYDSASCKKDSNLFDVNKKNINALKSRTEQFLQDNWPNKKFRIYGRQNVIKPLDLDTPHSHPNADIVGVFYTKVTKDSGDILLLDPRFNLPVFWQKESMKNNFTPSRPFIRINPYNGLLIFFPSYIIHSVETNKSNDTRVSIAINIMEENND